MKKIIAAIAVSTLLACGGGDSALIGNYDGTSTDSVNGGAPTSMTLTATVDDAHGLEVTLQATVAAVATGNGTFSVTGSIGHAVIQAGDASSCEIEIGVFAGTGTVTGSRLVLDERATMTASRCPNANDDGSLPLTRHFVGIKP